jgi:hypothetical protein
LASVSTPIEELRRVMVAEKIKEFDKSKDFIREQLQQEISAKLWGTAAEVEASFDNDPAIQKAVELLSNIEQYQAMLKGEPMKREK